jgi:two-component system LytT family response regulator
MKYLVADDDPLVCEQVESFLTRLGDTDFCLKAGDGLTALQLLSGGDIDAAFLDLQMPGLDGVSLLRALPRGLPIVIVTASKDFGAGSYEFAVADYLLKPLEFPRFIQAVEKIRTRLAPREPDRSKNAREIFVKDGTKLVRVALDDLLYVKSEANYVEFVSEHSNVLILMSMKRLEERLPVEFMRVHRSYIVNLQKIARIEDNSVHLGKHRIPVSETYRDELRRRLPVIQ